MCKLLFLTAEWVNPDSRGPSAGNGLDLFEMTSSEF
jgi:hypothetical protein